MYESGKKHNLSTYVGFRQPSFFLNYYLRSCFQKGAEILFYFYFYNHFLTIQYVLRKINPLYFRFNYVLSLVFTTQYEYILHKYVIS